MACNEKSVFPWNCALVIISLHCVFHTGDIKHWQRVFLLLPDIAINYVITLNVAVCKPGQLKQSVIRVLCCASPVFSSTGLGKVKLSDLLLQL